MNMKEKMAKMRASKAVKQASKKPAEEKPIKKVEPKADIAPAPNVLIKTPIVREDKPQVKSWKVKIDMGMMPEDQYTYFFHYILPELRKAARSGKKITGFSWDEKRRLIPEFAKEEAFE